MRAIPAHLDAVAAAGHQLVRDRAIRDAVFLSPERVAIRIQDDADLHASVRALDRVLRAERFTIPQWINNSHWVAYYDMYRYPEPLPPLALGQLDFWWHDAEAEAELRAQGAL